MLRIRSDLRRSPASAVGLVVLVGLIGGIVLVLVAGTLRTASAPDRYVASLRATPDARVEQGSGRARTAEIHALPAVDSVVSATFVFGGLRDAKGDFVDALVFAGDVGALGRVVSGREPDPSAPNEFAASRSLVEATGAQIGDEMDLFAIAPADADRLGFDAPLPDEATLTATLVGIFGGAGELEEGFTLTVFPSALLDADDVGISASVHMVSLSPGAVLDDLRNQLDMVPGGTALGVEPAEIVSADIRRAVRTQSQGLVILSAIVTVAAVAVVGRLLSRQARLAPGEERALSSLGMTGVQRRLDPVARLAAPVAAGALLSGLVAFGASDRFPRGFVREIEPTPGRRFDPLVHIVGPAALVLVLLGWAYLVLRPPPTTAGSGRLTVAGVASVVGAGRLGRAVRFGLPPAVRSSSATPLAALVSVLAVLVGALTFGASLDLLIDDPGQHGEFAFGLGQGGRVVPAESIERLESDPDIVGLALAGSANVSIGGHGTEVSGFEVRRGNPLPEPFEGRQPTNSDEITLGRVTARQHDLDIGDEVTVTGVTGPSAFRVVGISAVPGVAGADGLGRGGIVTADGLRRVDPEAGLGEAVIELRADAPPGTIDRLNGALGQAIGPREKPATIVNLARVRDIPAIVAVVLAALAMLSLVHHLVTTTHRQRRDLAVLRSLGATRSWLRSLVHTHAMVYTALAVALAVPVGVIAGRLAFRSLAWSIGAREGIVVPAAALVIGGAVLLVLSNVAAFASLTRRGHPSPAAELRTEI